MSAKKVLVIRFSSFGDVLQSLSLPGHISNSWPDAEIHFLTRKDFVPLVQDHPNVYKVWSFDKRKGFLGLVRLARQLAEVPWTHVYDSHNNLRSQIVTFFINGWFGLRRSRRGHRFLRRSIYRWKRFLLFRFRINKFEMPFSGQRDQLKPLEEWGISFSLPDPPQFYLKSRTVEFKTLMIPEHYIALAPSAAHELKRWPLEHWKKLIGLFPDTEFVVLGGPEDKFLSELAQLDETRVVNLAGRLSLKESAEVVMKSQLLVSNDTGLMHVAEQTGKPCIALMGPAPFGFPSRKNTKVMELQLRCRPCSKHGQGPCINKDIHQKCLVEIRPEAVANEVGRILQQGQAHI
ncbi:MAG: glycosyltransferase family 9 protein [Pseudomonadota bacterium]